MDDQHFCAPLACRRKSHIADDHSIQSTNDDAVEAKASAVNLGYWEDEFLAHFAKTVERKPPEINRGYYARVKAIRMLVDRFLQIFGEKSQIVNLGAGFDTLFWRLSKEKAVFGRFIEIDFSSITAKKISHINKPHCPLRRLISENDDQIVQSEHRNLLGPHYCLIGADIRDTRELEDRLKLITDLDRSLPTLFIAECVLVYMSSMDSSNLCAFLAAQFSRSCFINYELVNLKDTFGEVFKKNMLQRGLSLAGVNICDSLQSQIDRFVSVRWTKVQGHLMTDIYRKFLDQNDIHRVEALEFLDEQELLIQLLQHYCIVLALSVDDSELNRMLL